GWAIWISLGGQFGSQYTDGATFSAGRDINVMLFPYQPKNFDVLLGMDMLTGYHITMFRNRIVVSN
ncbi:MAG: hypothetical protein OXL40_12315, partial [Bacteroidota bacterium]|nr:hypothetical protein [Bacteroidota bacterium]